MIEASSEVRRGTAIPARTYRGIESNSSARKTMIRSDAIPINIMPQIANISSG